MSYKSFLLILCVQIGFLYSATITIEKCSLSDSKCLLKEAQRTAPLLTDGISELSIEPLDVMHVDEMKVELAGLILSMKNANIKGLKKANVDSISFDMKKKQIRVVYYSEILLSGKYKAGGRLLVLPISGEGDVVIKLKNLKIELTMPYNIIKDKDGKDVLELTDYKYKYEVRDGVHFQLTNLFNGNKVLSETMLNFMNENWKLLMTEFGRPVLEVPIKKVFTAIKKYVGSQPLQNIALY